MQREVWLLMAHFSLETVPMAAFGSEDEACDVFETLLKLPERQLAKVIANAWAQAGQYKHSEFVELFVVKVPKLDLIQFNRPRTVSGVCPDRSSGDRG